MAVNLLLSCCNIVAPAACYHTQVELRAGDVPWAEFLAGAEAPASLQVPHVADASQEVTNIIFSSGTTGVK